MAYWKVQVTATATVLMLATVDVQAETEEEALEAAKREAATTDAGAWEMLRDTIEIETDPDMVTADDAEREDSPNV